VRVEVSAPGTTTLLLFLSATCDGCHPLWALVRRPDSHGLASVRTVAVVDPKGWRQRLAITRLAGRAGRRNVVRSPQAYADYRVHAPFFVLVEGDGPSVTTEGVAWGADDVAGHVTAAMSRTPRSRR
jgi:hypothetical protein